VLHQGCRGRYFVHGSFLTLLKACTAVCRTALHCDLTSPLPLLLCLPIGGRAAGHAGLGRWSLAYWAFEADRPCVCGGAACTALHGTPQGAGASASAARPAPVRTSAPTSVKPGVPAGVLYEFAVTVGARDVRCPATQPSEQPVVCCAHRPLVSPPPLVCACACVRLCTASWRAGCKQKTAGTPAELPSSMVLRILPECAWPVRGFACLVTCVRATLVSTS
jgi:hypothetical protein